MPLPALLQSGEQWGIPVHTMYDATTPAVIPLCCMMFQEDECSVKFPDDELKHVRHLENQWMKPTQLIQVCVRCGIYYVEIDDGIDDGNLIFLIDLNSTNIEAESHLGHGVVVAGLKWKTEGND